MIAGNPLFYKNVTPIDTQTHENLRIGRPERPLDYAREANLIPALVDEFELAMVDLPIAFLPGADIPSAVFVTGATPGTNAYISDEGLWTGAYVPAYLRRYPFIIGNAADGQPLLCIDDTYPGLGEEEGERFFTEDGQHAEPLQQALALAQSYRDVAIKTEKFCKMLRDFDLLQPATLDTTAADGSKSVVHGILIINETRLSELSGEQLKELNQEGLLKSIYAQIASLRSVSKLSPAKSDVVEPREKVDG